MQIQPAVGSQSSKKEDTCVLESTAMDFAMSLWFIISPKFDESRHGPDFIKLGE